MTLLPEISQSPFRSSRCDRPGRKVEPGKVVAICDYLRPGAVRSLAQRGAFGFQPGAKRVVAHLCAEVHSKPREERAREKSSD